MAAHRTTAEFDDAIEHFRSAPADAGTVTMIVRRPADGTREIIDTAVLDVDAGLEGDNWQPRGSTSTADGSADPERQLTVMNARVVEFIGADAGHRALAGDQLYVDLDLSHENLPAGTRLALGTAVIEVTPPPHLGCKKFLARYGLDALAFVNSTAGKQFRLRGLNAKIVRSGVVNTGDVVSKTDD